MLSLPVKEPRKRAAIEASLLAALIAVLILLAGTGHYLLDFKKFRNAHQDQENTVVERARAVLQTALASAVSDTRLLAQTVRQVGTPASLGDARTETLAELFSALSRERPMYDQIRLLSYRGRELIRVNREPDGPNVVGRKELQDKSKRYYFAQARDLAAGQIYVSPVDVNIEWGKVEAVPRPMFRLATPVFDDSGHRRGVVLINYRGEALGEIFKQAMGNTGERLMVVDDRSYWLSNPRQELEWGFVYDPDARFQNYYPQVWQRMVKQAGGTHVDHRGIFTFALLDLEHALGVADSPGSSWFIVSLFPNALLHQALGIGSYLGAYGLLVLLGFVAAVGFGRARARQLQALVRLQGVEPLGQALEAAVNPVIVTDSTDKVVLVNDALLVHAGYSRHDLLGQGRIDMLVPPASGEACRSRLRGLIAGKLEPGVFDAGLLGRSGDNYRLSWGESLQRNTAGEITGVVYIGEVPRSELPPDERLQNLAIATEQSPVSVMITDTDGHIEYVNSRFSALTGYTNEEVLGQKPSILKSGKSPPEDYRQLWSNLKAGREWQGVFHNRKKSGHLYLEAATISPLRNESGNVTHFLALKEDITERVRLEKNFRLSVEAAPSAMILTNSAGTIVLANARTEQMFGYTREEMLGQPLEMLVPRAGRERHAGLRRQYNAQPTAREMGSELELSAEHREGHKIPVDIGLNPIETDEGTMVLSSIVDLSERNALQYQLEERNRQVVEAHALATVGRMAAMVAHDLRNPLSSVKMGLQILNRSASRSDDAGDREIQGIALEQVQYMEKILSELLSYARPAVLNREWFDVAKTVDKTVLLCQKEVQRHQVRLNVWSQPSLPTLYGDSHRLQQVISNLIGNSIEACAEAGIKSPEISVRTHLDLGEDIPRICIEIIDNGPGLDAESERRAFEAFFTSRAKGTGLGLTIVRQIVAAHGGVVTVVNEPGAGARASIIMPTRPLDKSGGDGTPHKGTEQSQPDKRPVEVVTSGE
ncbi:MAG TPA: hypothetical protein DF863_07895 [Gammaproteobacteria bacterium]|nr:hypothetical protein [Gammaproteobacteria bacterium]